MVRSLNCLENAKAEEPLPSRRIVVLLALLAVLAAGWYGWQKYSSRSQDLESSAATVDKQPATILNHTFDPANPPTDLPPLAPGEAAMCDSNFISNVNVGGRAQQTDATHEIVTITKINVALQLNVNIWVPIGATQHVIEHEDGHRQISENYYQNADKLAQRIAAAYLGKHELINGADLPAEFSKLLKQIGAEITDEYNKQLNPEPAQLRYDAVTDHSRNDVEAKDAVAQILKDLPPAISTAATYPGN